MYSCTEKTNFVTSGIGVHFQKRGELTKRCANSSSTGHVGTLLLIMHQSVPASFAVSLSHRTNIHKTEHARDFGALSDIIEKTKSVDLKRKLFAE